MDDLPPRYNPHAAPCLRENPVLGLIQRGEKVILHMLANVRQKTIEPIIKSAVAPSTPIHTDEYGIYARFELWGYGHKHPMVMTPVEVC